MSAVQKKTAGVWLLEKVVMDERQCRWSSYVGNSRPFPNGGIFCEVSVKFPHVDEPRKSFFTHEGGRDGSLETRHVVSVWLEN